MKEDNKLNLADKCIFDTLIVCCLVSLDLLVLRFAHLGNIRFVDCLKPIGVWLFVLAIYTIVMTVITSIRDDEES